MTSLLIILFVAMLIVGWISSIENTYGMYEAGDDENSAGKSA